MNYPILFYFGQTNQDQFPLVLMIGREPNTDMKIVKESGPYDFREYPRAGFWNIAYGLVAQSVRLEGWQLKQLCVQKNGSPILFANALPIGLKNQVADKNSYRGAVDVNDVAQHIRDVFAFENLISRVAMVIMSGLDDAVFAPSCKAIMEECNNREIPFAKVPFFFGPNKSKIEMALTKDDWEKLKTIGIAFKK